MKKNIILQHWTGENSPLEELNILGKLSSKNISKYAKKIGAEYKLLRGNIFRSNLSPPCQKIYMLDEVFDDYDIVVMIDIDMFTRKGMEENIFEDVDGIGRHTTKQTKLFKKLQRGKPNLCNSNYPYWGGAIYRLTRDMRQRLRVHIIEEEIVHFSKFFVDEGIMHRLATLADLEENYYLPGNHWDCGNYEEGVETAAMIHIRTKTGPRGPKKPKIENYRTMVKQGLIEE